MATDVKRLRKEARIRGLDLHSLPVRNRHHLERALENLGKEPADAFFLLFDADLFDDANLGMVERFVEKRDLIYIVPDSSLTSTGGAFAHAPGFRAMGEQAGQLIRQILLNEERPLQLGLVTPQARSFVVQRAEK